MNRMLRPRNGIHANAYAASDAITSGKIDAGIVIAIELMNDCPRLTVVASPPSTAS